MKGEMVEVGTDKFTGEIIEIQTENHACYVTIKTSIEGMREMTVNPAYKKCLVVLEPGAGGKENDIG